MLIYELTNTEADYLQIVCGFTDDENALFELRRNKTPIEDCAEILHVSVPTAKRISQSVNRKIKREM